jgi:hypothetical protein
MDPFTLHIYEDRNVPFVPCFLLREYYMHVTMFFGDVSFIIKDGGPQGCDSVLLA